MPHLRFRKPVYAVVAIALAIPIVGTAAGPGSRAAVAAQYTSGCPAKAPRGVESSRRGAGARLVPRGANGVLLCRYDGPFGAPMAAVANRFRLVARLRITSQQQVRRLAAALNRLPRLAGSRGCSANVGTIVGFFHYPSGPADPVLVQETDCQLARNGRLVRGAGLNGRPVLDELEARVPARPGSAARRGGTAIIAGHIRLCGGPAPGSCFTSTVGGCTPEEGCSQSDRVVAVDEAGRIAAEQPLSPSAAHFRLSVRPGNYVLELLADGRHVHGRLLQAKGATVGPRRQTTVIFGFSVP